MESKFFYGTNEKKKFLILKIKKQMCQFPIFFTAFSVIKK